eukprot:Anaeramoba_flamelloidesa813782_16.p2 GENE.a813782_16~~a813782_16.p2  ORF type:complete len:102 (-),score=10.58 a813782_16:77-382(-)
MQYHLNGFKPGNYEVPDEAREPYPTPPIVDLPDAVDVLIIGTGPAGLTMARQLAEFPDIKTCIVDMAPGPLLFGRENNNKKGDVKKEEREKKKEDGRWNIT